MRYRQPFGALLAACLLASIAGSDAIAGGIDKPKAILDGLGLRADQPLGAVTQPGTVIKATVLDPRKLAPYGFIGLKQGDAAVVTVTGTGKFMLQAPQRTALSVDPQGKITRTK